MNRKELTKLKKTFSLHGLNKKNSALWGLRNASMSLKCGDPNYYRTTLIFELVPSYGGVARVVKKSEKGVEYLGLESFVLTINVFIMYLYVL